MNTTPILHEHMNGPRPAVDRDSLLLLINATPRIIYNVVYIESVDIYMFK